MIKLVFARMGAALLLLSAVACGDIIDPPADPRFEPLVAAVQQDLASTNATAASVAVWLDGEILWVGGFGHADPEGAVAPDEDTLFMIGSDTKKITALSLLRKVAAGRTTLDTSVASLLPDLHPILAPGFPAATLRELLSHRSGIVDGVESTASTTDAALASFTYGEFATTYYPLTPPGRFWNYSNPNYSIAGLIDQELDGRMWADIVEQDLFPALGMTRTIARKSAVDANHALGRGYTASDQTVIQRVSLEDTWESAFDRPAGLVWSTPGDQVRLARFLVDGDPAVLDPSLLRELTRPQTQMYPDLPVGYGFGLNIVPGFGLGSAWYDVEAWTHGGNTQTHTSTFFVLPAQRFAISILSNGYGDNFTASLNTAISTLVDLPPPGVRPALFDPSQLDALTGTYVDPADLGEIAVTRQGDALSIEIPALDGAGVPYQRVLTALSTRVWLAQIAGAPRDLAFIDGPDGETYLRNRAFVAVRPPGGQLMRARPFDREAVLRTVRAMKSPTLPTLPSLR